MMNKIVFNFFTAVLLSGSAQLAIAQDRGDALRDQISRTARRIQSTVEYSEASVAELRQAQLSMQDALELLSGHGGDDGRQEECLNYAYAAYFRSLSSVAAHEKSIAACKIIGSLDAAKKLYEWHFRSLSSAAAMDKAASEATRALRGRDEILEFGYTNYFKSLSSSASASRAAANTATVPRTALACLTRSYERRFQSHSSAVAMDGAYTDCQAK